MGKEKMKRKQIAFSEDTYMKIEKAALEISIKKGKIVRWSEIVHYMVENYLNDVKNDMIHQRDSEESKKK